MLAAAAGAAVAVGSFLPWARISAFGFGQSVRGPDLTDAAYAGTAVGLLVVASGSALVAGRGARFWAILALVGGVAAAAFAFQRILSVEDAVRERALEGLGGTAPPGEFDRIFEVAPGIGLWLMLAGGVVAVVSGLVAATARGGSGATHALDGVP